MRESSTAALPRNAKEVSREPNAEERRSVASRSASESASNATSRCPRCMATRLLACSALVVITLASSASAADWGNLAIRFTYGGNAPEPSKLELNKDMDFCGPFDLRDESLLVDPKSKGIGNVVVWLDEKKSGRDPEVHESYAKELEKEVVVANAKCRFVPHVQTMRVGQTLRITNEDDIAHAAAVYFLKNPPVSAQIVPTGDDVRKDLVAELIPCSIKCPIHAWMGGYLLIKDHPYVGVSDAEGNVVIENIPAGEWTFRVWHETAGYLDEVTIDGAKKEWRLGRFDVTIPAKETAKVGTAIVAAEAFED